MNIKNSIANSILEKIKEYDIIMIFRHNSPDYDALGTQFGMYYFLKENFKDKKIYAPGFSNVVLADGLYPENDNLDDKVFENKFLGICLDTGNTKRISDERFKKADFIIKIDHHPNVEPYGDINLVCDDAAAASELVYKLFNTGDFKKYKINDLCAKYLFSGIVGDTGRFNFSSTSSYTFKTASELVKKDFKIVDDVYFPMYKKKLSEMKAMQHVLNNYKISEHGVAYYTLYDKDLKQFGLDCDEAKIFLSLFSSYEEIKIWVSLSEDVRENNFRASVRSRNIKINEVCANYRGGGHECASGARCDTYEECLKLIEDLDKEITR